MKRVLMLACLGAGCLALTGCAEGPYRHRPPVGVSLSWSTYPYWGWYDGYYGTIYDGYWGLDDFFYYRLLPSDRTFRRGDPSHFRRDDTRPSDQRFQRFQGDLRPPAQGTTMPQFRPPSDDRRAPPDRRDRP